MKKYIFKRILQALPMLFVISIISFALMNFAPGNPAHAFITPKMNAKQVAKIKEELGLNDPVPIRYTKWLKNCTKGNFGYSYITHEPVLKEMGVRLPTTLGLMGVTMLMSVIISIPLGMISALKKNSKTDNIITGISYIGISIPSFWFAMLIIILFSSKLKLLPSSGMRSIGVNSPLDLIKHSIMPCAVLCFPNIAVLTRYIRSSALSQLKEDYIVTALSKGLSTKAVLYKHVLKNSILPLITILGMSLPELVSGAFITETIFGWPGMGRFGVEAIFNRDYPVIMAMTLISSSLLILGNLISDILYGIVDPRIRVVDK
ncbi:ABC transporter permease [Clostridium sp. KNHs214]|uniref:ABC transporter permease n=1 Tax=Clostridium sp. KNHs214 TaxID=1540257 RepID=UPI0005580303|nr:ABC transporter permease [Clostridium sp. KNHs214]